MGRTEMLEKSKDMNGLQPRLAAWKTPRSQRQNHSDFPFESDTNRLINDSDSIIENVEGILN
jgi:hypothetical protein